ncbi:MAG: TIR domain-containing protein [Methyloceanibacter sp.]
MSGPESSAKPPGQPGYSAFISYATEADRETAFKIVEHLEAHGLKCWIAPRNVRAGKQYAGEIVRGIGTARSFILVLSQASNNSKFVRREVEQADRKDKPIYAVRIEQVDPSDDLQLFLSEIHWIDAWQGDLAAHIKPLGELLREEETAGASPEPKPEAPTPKPKQPAVSPAEPASKARKQATLIKREPKERAEPDRLTTSLAGRSWLFAIRGALALAAGGALISDGQYPVTAESLAVTASLLAAYLIADGSLALITGIGLRSSPWRFAFIVEGLLAMLGAASLLTAGYEPTRVAIFMVAIAAARVVAALRIDARDGRWSLLTSAACLFGFVFVFVAASMGADHMVWGSTYLTTWGLLLFAVGAAFLFVAFHLVARRRALQTAYGLAQMRGATAALARISPAFAAAGVVLIAAGLPFLLWWLLPASPAWDVFGTPFAAVAATAVGIFLYGALALISGLRMERGSWPRLPFILYGGASVLLGASTLADLFSEPYAAFTPSAALLIEDSLDRFFGSWGLWALVTGGLLLALAVAIDDGKFRLAGAAVALLAVGFFLVLAASDFTAQESMFLFWMGTVTIIAGVIHMLFASSLRTYETRADVSAPA